MGNQEAAAVEDDDIAASYCQRLDFLDDDEVPGGKPRTHAPAYDAQNNVTPFTKSVEKLMRTEILRAGNQRTH